MILVQYITHKTLIMHYVSRYVSGSYCCMHTESVLCIHAYILLYTHALNTTLL